MADKHISTWDVISDLNVLGLLFFMGVSLVFFFNQEWGSGIVLLCFPLSIAIFTFTFRILAILKPNTHVDGLPLEQFPFGDEHHLAILFKWGLVISMLILLVLGYEYLVSPAYFQVLFDTFMFMITFVYIICFHLAVNKVWVTARVELDYRDVMNEMSAPGDGGGAVGKKYVLWGATRERFNRFSIINIIMFAFILLANFIELAIIQDRYAIPISLPEDGAGGANFGFPVVLVTILVLEPVIFIFILGKAYKEIYNYDVDDLIPSLVKIEQDDKRRELIIKFLERAREIRFLSKNK
ncbi:hypothetical protein GF325_03050 [Candidatus Bathyarchaeota archaeon]|nr:hypothetical protein [Candidatus Bathyarchaeota archaeon]